MTSRARIWRIGLVIAVLLASGLGLARSARELAIPLGLLVIAAFGLLAELASLRSLTRDSARSIDLDGAQPADGVVDIFRSRALRVFRARLARHSVNLSVWKRRDGPNRRPNPCFGATRHYWAGLP